MRTCARILIAGSIVIAPFAVPAAAHAEDRCAKAGQDGTAAVAICTGTRGVCSSANASIFTEPVEYCLPIAQ